MTFVDQHRTITDLEAEWSSLGRLLATLDDDDWTLPTCLPGWDVRAVVAHVIGTESMLLGEPTPAVEIDPVEFGHVRNDIGRLNEAWVASMHHCSPDEMRDRLADHAERRLAMLRAMDREAWEAEGFTPAGRDTYGRFMRIRVFDCWLHEQDVRDAVERPGHESGPVVESTLDEITAAMGFVVGKRAAAPRGSNVTFELTGGSRRTVHVEVGERAAVVEAFSGSPSVTLQMPVGTFTRLAAGRTSPAAVSGRVEVFGDVELGARILANLAYTL